MDAALARVFSCEWAEEGSWPCMPRSCRKDPQGAYVSSDPPVIADMPSFPNHHLAAGEMHDSPSAWYCAVPRNDVGGTSI
jgi:hypothetical protein